MFPIAASAPRSPTFSPAMWRWSQATPVELKSYLDSGKIRPLAVTAAARSKQLPDVPTVGETLKSKPVITYNGLLAPGRTPQGIVDLLAHEIVAAEMNEDFQHRLVSLGVDPIAITPAEFVAIIAEDTERWLDVVRELNLKPQTKAQIRHGRRRS